MKIAIIGGGPSGSVSAALFARDGHDVAIFDEGSRPEIISGESLVPGVIPIFRRLGIEDQIAAISLLKPGVTFIPMGGKKIEFRFSSLPKKFPRYAYNTPRPALDEILEQVFYGLVLFLLQMLLDLYLKLCINSFEKKNFKYSSLIGK